VSLPPGATNARRVGGGDINEAWRVTLADGREAFVKTRSDAGADEYATEARGLEWLAEPGALRTPRVLEVADDYLMLEWVQQGSPSAEGAEELGRGLALTHAAGAPVFGAATDGAPGAVPATERHQTDGESNAAASTFGSLQLPNDPTPDWPAFYAQRRLLPLVGIARERGALSERGAHAVEAVCERLPSLAGHRSHQRACTGTCGAATR